MASNTPVECHLIIYTREDKRRHKSLLTSRWSAYVHVRASTRASWPARYAIRVRIPSALGFRAATGLNKREILDFTLRFPKISGFSVCACAMKKIGIAQGTKVNQQSEEVVHASSIASRAPYSPTQPSQPADSALCKNCTLALPRICVFSVVHAEVHTQPMNSKSLTIAKAASFPCYST